MGDWHGYGIGGPDTIPNNDIWANKIFAGAWGAEIRKRDERTEFRVNELVRYSDGYEFNLFAETTRWLGLKVRIDGINLLNFEQDRDRALFVGERGLSPIEIVERRNITDGRRIVVTVSGTY